MRALKTALVPFALGALLTGCEADPFGEPLVVQAAAATAKKPDAAPSKPTPKRPTKPPAPKPPPPPRHVRLQYDVEGLAPLPFARGTVGTESTWMLLDTGASTHVATSQVVRRGGLPTKHSSEAIEDHARATLPTARTDLSRVALDGWGKMPRGQLLVIEQEESGIAAKTNVGVFLSPQKLERSAVTVLDLRAAELRTVRENEIPPLLDTRPNDPLKDGVRTCHGVFIVRAEVQGEPVELILDTGATRSTLYAATPAGKRLTPRATKSTMRGEGPSGKLASKTFKGAKIASGDLKTTTDVELFPGSPPTDCSNDGVLGFPELRSCILVFGPRDQLRARCE